MNVRLLYIILSTFCCAHTLYCQSATWRIVDSGYVDMRYLNVVCADSLHCATCADFQARLGFIRISDDGGREWRTIFGATHLIDNMTSFDTIRIRDVARPSPETIIGLGNNSRLVISHDTGRTWTSVQLDAADVANFIHMHDASNGVVIMYTRRLALTHDGWRSWTIVNAPDSFPLGTFGRGTLVDSLVVYVGHFLNVTGKATLVRYRIDTGEWAYYDNINADVYLIDFADSLNGCLFGPSFDFGPQSKPLVLRTTDGGNNWNSQPIDDSWLTGGMICASFFNRAVGYASGTAEYVLRTDDSGVTWKREDLPVLPGGNQNIFVAGLSENKAVAVEVYGLIVRREVTANAGNGEKEGKGLIVGATVHAALGIHILATGTPVKSAYCSLYNLLGEMVLDFPMKLIDERGSAEWWIPGSAVPPGLYLARVVASNEVATTKVMVTR